MSGDLWTELVVTPQSEEREESLVELFHENSKITRFDRPFSSATVARRMSEMWDSLPYDQYPAVELAPERAPMRRSLEEAMLTRHSARALAPTAVTLAQLTSLLTCAYGVTRGNEGTGFPRPFRTVPSAGALFPLELYLHTVAVPELDDGLYHYNPARANLRHLREGEQTDAIAACLAQPDVAYGAAVMLFITAAFERSTFKYGNRGYRFALLEAGHVAQNLNLAATGLGLGSMNLGGFFDAELDAFLQLDGVTHSTLYAVAVGEEIEDRWAAGELA